MLFSRGPADESQNVNTVGQLLVAITELDRKRLWNGLQRIMELLSLSDRITVTVMSLA